MEEKYMVIDAPGYYGNRARVWSSHKTLSAALRAAGKNEKFAVVLGNYTKGEKLPADVALRMLKPGA